MAQSLSPDAQITALMHRYATGIDTKNWELLASCFTEDAVSDYGEIGVWRSAHEITDYMAATHADMPNTKHMMHNVVVEVTDADHATAVTYVHVVLVLADPSQWIDAVGHYDDVLVRRDGQWRIAERRFTMARTVTSFQLGGS